MDQLPEDSFSLRGEVLSTLATDYYRLGQFDHALEYAQLDLALSEKSGMQEALSSSLNNLAAICSTLGRYEQAEDYLKRGIQIEEELGRNDKLAIRLGMLCEVYTLQGKMEEGLPLVKRALEIERAEGREDKAAVRMSQLGNALAHLQRYQEAEPYLSEALQLLTEYKNYSSLCLTGLALGETQHALGKTQEAEHSLLQTIQLAQQLEQRHTLMMAYLELARVYHDRNDNDDAYHYQELYVSLKDSISTEQVHQQISDLQVRYETAQDKLQLAEKEATIQRQKLITTAGIILLVILLIALAFVVLSLRVKKRMLILRDQLMRIISHDLKNPALALQRSLHILRDHYDSFEASDIQQEITRMADSSDAQVGLLENLLTWARIQTQRLEIKPINLDLNSVVEEVVQQHREQAAVKDITINTPDSQQPAFAVADRQTVCTIVRNLLSNAIKFSDTKSEIQIRTKGNILYIIDHGVGMNASASSTPGTMGEKGTGLGLELVDSLVKMNHASMEITSLQGEGTTVTLTFPKN